MGILDIQPVSRSGMRFLFSFYGLSETGKTFSALMIAAGLEPDPAKRMLLDTEGGGRGRAYESEIEGGYLYASLSPPYTPERYIQALDEIEAAGVTVLVTDSVSHAWAAEGGVLQMVEESTNRNDMAKWKEPKRRLGKMLQRYRSSDMHHILCSRAKVPKIEAVVDGRKTYIDGPVMPIQEKMMRYDMTVVAQMLGRGRFTVDAPQGKCPGNLLPIFGASELMNRDTGRRLREWVNAAHVISPEIRALKVRADEIAGQGAEAFRAFWADLGRDERDVLKVGLDNYQSIAKAADDERQRLAAETAEQEQEDREQVDTNLDAPFGSSSIELVGGKDQSATDPAPDVRRTAASIPATGATQPSLLHGDGQSLYVPTPGLRAKPADWTFFARQVVALIEEGHPREAIEKANPGINLLREKDPALYESTMARFAEAGETR